MVADISSGVTFNAGGNKISTVADPTYYKAATKNYVDTSIAAIPPSGGGVPASSNIAAFKYRLGTI